MGQVRTRRSGGLYVRACERARVCGYSHFVSFELRYERADGVVARAVFEGQDPKTREWNERRKRRRPADGVRGRDQKNGGIC